MRFNFNVLLIIALLLSCKSENPNEIKEEIVEKQIQVDLNPNIHTSHIIEMFVWPGEYPTRPLCIAAQKHFEPFKNHPAIKLSDSLLQNEIFYFDELTEILLYLEDFPSTKFKYPLEIHLTQIEQMLSMSGLKGYRSSMLMPIWNFS